MIPTILSLVVKRLQIQVSIHLFEDEEETYLLFTSPYVVETDKVVRAIEFISHIHFSMKPKTVEVLKKQFSDTFSYPIQSEDFKSEMSVAESAVIASFNHMTPNHHYRSWIPNDKKMIESMSAKKHIRDACYLIANQIIEYEFKGENDGV